MKVFFKAQLSSLLATAADFLLTGCFAELVHLHYTVAVMLGALGGAFTNFAINRYWSFNAQAMPVRQQTYRYGLVWLGSVLLNVSGVYLLTRFFGMHYMISKMIVAVIVGLSFNYLLQKEYVFGINEKSSS
jgi:putative flippase GtrA